MEIFKIGDREWEVNELEKGLLERKKAKYVGKKWNEGEFSDYVDRKLKKIRPPGPEDMTEIAEGLQVTPQEKAWWEKKVEKFPDWKGDSGKLRMKLDLKRKPYAGPVLKKRGKKK